MYLSADSFFLLDSIVKKFEVAFRSYVADELILKITDKNRFKDEINEIEKTFNLTSFILATRYKSKIVKLKKEYEASYSQLNVARDAYLSKSYPGDAPYVSLIVDIFVLFFEKCYSSNSLIKNFSSTDELLYSVNSYHRLRNDLSHPGAKQVLVEDAILVSKFIRKVVDSADEKYYWFSSQKEITSLIFEFSDTLNQAVLKVENFDQIPIQHKKLICREEELGRLYDCIIGKEGYKRVAGSVIVFGYGGVGKTALVVDFLFRLVQDINNNKNKYEMDFILFYSSKEEFLKRMETSGEIYIEKIERQISSFDEFLMLLCRDLNISKINEIQSSFKRGIVVIDNIENLTNSDKEKLFSFIKTTPRNVQFILTSRNEEQCEEKINVEEYRDLEKGRRFINEYLEVEEYVPPLDLKSGDDLLKASKGNTLILVQSLNSIINKISSIGEIVSSLEPVRTKEAHIIADFMYKNTFDSAIADLEAKGFNPKDLIVVTSLYKEPIDLYSIGKLCRIDIGTASEICLYLTKCLIFIKHGEYFKLNEFANNFIFIKMLPDRIELNKIKDRVGTHKSRMVEKIRALDSQMEGNSAIREMMDDWKPRNYIDKIIIAECFVGYKDFNSAIQNKDRARCDRLLREFAENEMITSHPYVQFQKAQILTRFYKSKIYKNERAELLNSMQRAYEDSIESIDFNYPHVRGTKSHGAVYMFFGIQLLEEFRDYSKAVRNLEEATKIINAPTSKLFFDLRFYLAKAHNMLYRQTKDTAYLASAKKVINQILTNEKFAANFEFDLDRFKSSFQVSGELAVIEPQVNRPRRHKKKKARKAEAVAMTVN